MLALLWDMNGVLVDDEPIQERVWREVLAAHGIVLDSDAWRAHCMGHKIWPALQGLFPQLDAQTLRALMGEKQRRYREVAAGGLPRVAGALELVGAAAAQSIPQAVVTSASYEEVTIVLDQLQAQAFFATVIHGAHVARDKPAPDCYLLAAQRLGVNPQDCWVIEDSLAGVAAGRAAGMRVIAATTSLDAADLDHADIVVDAFHPSLLRRLQTDWVVD
jgi:HAD superfamily hydrolase (TIGR01509 family)